MARTFGIFLHNKQTEAEHIATRVQVGDLAESVAALDSAVSHDNQIAGSFWKDRSNIVKIKDKSLFNNATGQHDLGGIYEIVQK